MTPLSRIILAALFAISLVLATFTVADVVDAAEVITTTCTSVDGNADESCLAQEAETPPKAKAKANNQQPPRKNIRVIATFRNDSPHRADIHFDDGRFGNIVGTAEANGGEVKVDTFSNHRFFVTMHGVRESLVDPETDEQYFFQIQHDSEERQLFTLPQTAAPSQTKCKDRYPICKHEAARGECTRNPGWMIVNCCKACDDKEGYGHLIDSKVRCDPKRLNSTIPAWTSGSLEELFTNWATKEEFKQYAPNVVSSPNKVHDAQYDGPWIMTFDNFLSNFEIDQLIKGAQLGDGFQRSTDQGKIVGGSGEMAKVTSKSRTSSNAWCRSECENLEGVKSVTKRIEEVTGIPENNYESFQILKYKEGQFYRKHHDSSNANRNKPAGHRILTFFLYLNDVEEGGGTGFTNLDIEVTPKKGRALIWPSVQNGDPNSTDMRMYHEAKEVIKGTKYAANHWIHQYDFRNANLWGCNGSFG